MFQHVQGRIDRNISWLLCVWPVSGGRNAFLSAQWRGRRVACACVRCLSWGSWWYITWLRPGCQQSQIDFRYTMESSNWWHSVLCTVLYCTVLCCTAKSQIDLRYKMETSSNWWWPVQIWCQPVAIVKPCGMHYGQYRLVAKSEIMAAKCWDEKLFIWNKSSTCRT